MSDLRNKLISEMNSTDDLYTRLTEWFGVSPVTAREYIKGLTFSKYNRLMEATVDRNPSLTSGTTTSGDPKYSDDLSDLENLMKNKDGAEDEPEVKNGSKPPSSDHNNFDDFDPDYLPSYIKNKRGDINFKKIKKGDRIAYVDDYGKTLHGIVKGDDGKGNYDIDTYHGAQSGIEKGRLRTPRELVWRYKNKETGGGFKKGKEAARAVDSAVSGYMDKADSLTKMESDDSEIARMKELAGVSETASSGATPL